MKLLRHQRVDVELAETAPTAQPPPVRLLSRAERAHYRLRWRAAPGTQRSQISHFRCLDQTLRDTRRFCRCSRPSHRLSVARSRFRKTKLSSSISHLSLTPWPLYCSVSPLLTISGEREESFFKAHDRSSFLLSLARCASRGIYNSKTSSMSG